MHDQELSVCAVSLVGSFSLFASACVALWLCASAIHLRNRNCALRRRRQQSNRHRVCNTILYTQMLKYYSSAVFVHFAQVDSAYRVYTAVLSTWTLHALITFEHTHTHTQHEWLLPDYNACVEFQVRNVFIWKYSLFPALARSLSFYRRTEHACVVHLPLTIIIKFYYVFFGFPRPINSLDCLRSNEIPPKF